uniref:Hydrolase_4 domain-containing protein n=1 Tax=Steinernema glaseri TaxID=37863 RepID=A0A1I7XZY2_9BILA
MSAWIAVVVVAAIVGFPICLYVYTRQSARKPRIYGKHGSAHLAAVLKHCPHLHKVYMPTWWCPWGFLQTAVRQIFRSCPSLPFEREIVTFEDGGELGVDWLHSDDLTDTSPIVLLLPGITGSTHDSSYILHVVLECQRLGYRAVVVNPRGLGGVPLKTPKTYNAAVTDDLEVVVKKVNKRFPKAKKLGCGFSMGGMILWNYMAKCETAEATGLNAAMIISSPFNPMDATFTIEEPFPKLFFNSHLAENLKGIVRPYEELFKDRCDWDKVMSVKTVREFDKAFVVSVFGYKDWFEYYYHAALYYKVHQIKVPTICLNAADDCFSPLKSIPFKDISVSDNVVSVVTEHGGHTAFMKHFNPSSNGLIEDLFDEYTKIVFEDKI